MIAFLTSSPCIYGAPRAILNPENDFLDNLTRCLPEHPRCLFICASPDDPAFTDRVGSEMRSAFREAGIDFSDFFTLDRRNQHDAQLLIWKSDFIILSGGHVPTQNAFFREIGLKDMIHNFQGVVLGISAGTMNAATRVYAQPEEAGESRPDFVRFYDGLGLTDINVLPHYQQVKDYMLDGKRLFEDVTYADSMGECFFSFVDGTYLLIEEGIQMIIGECRIIRDGVMEPLSEVGEIVIVES